MSVAFETSELWKRTLGERADDPQAEYRTQLRSAYLQFRRTVEPLAGEIAISMPMFTDHSIDHIDALWDTASLIMGQDFPINPAEAFVLGGAFLLHDLGMGLAAFPAGKQSIREDPLFADARAALLSSSTMTDAQADDAAVVQVLRVRHARQAERIVSQEFQVDDSKFYLLQDAALRSAYGPMIGQIAHSHWFEVSDLSKYFGVPVGALPSFPPDWIVDTYKIACILRLADAAQIDSRRAPLYLRAFRKPSGVSAEHWKFQQRLTRPRKEADRLVFTSTSAFSADEAAAWWLAYDTINMISNELRKVDAACADLGKHRFPIRSVAGADNPARFAEYLRTEGWVPVDASLRVGNVNRVVEHLGGAALYGNEPMTGLRELISNAADATRARRAQFGGPDLAIEVTLEEKSGQWILSVRDRGLGMTGSQMVANLTDFGTSNWLSAERLEEYPGLLSSGYHATGRFGIGFYACFMLADRVEVKSLKFRRGSEETSILIFEDGVRARPLLRRASEDEQIDLGGTEVRLFLKHAPFAEHGLLRSHYRNAHQTEADVLAEELKELCALLDTDLTLRDSNAERSQVLIRGGEWKTAAPGDLFELLYQAPADVRQLAAYNRLKGAFEKNVEDIIGDDGDIVGRAAFVIDEIGEDSGREISWSVPRPTRARIHVGGMKAHTIHNLHGAFVGEPFKADRNSAYPIASPEKLKEWAESQGSRVATSKMATSESLFSANQTVLGFGGNVENLVCGYLRDGPVRVMDLSSWISRQSKIFIIDTDDIFTFPHPDGSIKFFEFFKGQFLELPENTILSDYYTEWLVAEDVVEEPKNELFKKHINWKTEQWDPAYWWYNAGRHTVMHQILQAAAKAWNCDYIELGLTLERLNRKVDGSDTRLSLRGTQGLELRLDAFALENPTL